MHKQEHLAVNYFIAFAQYLCKIIKNSQRFWEHLQFQYSVNPVVKSSNPDKGAIIKLRLALTKI
jgi:hypothetical protein